MFPGEARMRGVAVDLRRRRVPLPADDRWTADRHPGHTGAFGQVWFRTRGCSWDRRGACTMCNYGVSDEVTTEAMVVAVAQALEAVGSVEELYVSPSGSFLDETEVPADARRAIIRLVAAASPRRVTFETRPETVSAAVLRDVMTDLGIIELAVGCGVESSDPWVLDRCVRRMGTLDAVQEAFAAAAAVGATTYANVSLGTAFLSPVEQLQDAIDTVRWSLGHGADLAIVFPVHVKRHTVVGALHAKGLYRPPSLWALVRCLEAFAPEELARTQVAWYRRPPSAAAIVTSPTTCPACVDRLLALLDSYRSSGDAQSVARMAEVSCRCRAEWERSMEPPSSPLPERVRAGWEALAEQSTP